MRGCCTSRNESAQSTRMLCHQRNGYYLSQLTDCHRISHSAAEIEPLGGMLGVFVNYQRGNDLSVDATFCVGVQKSSP